MVIKSLSLSAKIMAFVSMFVMLCVISVFIWVVTGPRSLSFIKPYIEDEINKISDDFKVEIDDSLIKWDGFDRAFSIVATNVVVKSDTNEKMATFPKVSIDFSVVKFFSGQVISSGVTLLDPVLYMNLSKQELYVAPTGEQKVKKVFLNRLYNIVSKNDISLPINNIRVKNASLFVNNGISEFVWNIKEGYAKLEQTDGKNTVISEVDINFGSNGTYLKASIEAVDEMLDIRLSYRDLPFYLLSDLFPGAKNLKNINFELDGAVNFLLAQSGSISQMAFSIDKADGKLFLESIFEEKMHIKSLKGRGNIYNDFTSMSVDELEADLDGPIIRVSGNLTNHGELPEIKPEISANVIVSNLKIEELDKFWPKGAGNKSRAWVLEHIESGVVDIAKGEFKFNPQDFVKLKAWFDEIKIKGASSLPMPIGEDSIKAEVHVKGAKVKYLPNFPSVKEISASAFFSGSGMNVEVESGKTLESKITDATVKMVSFWQRPISLEIEAAFEGRAEDAIHFLEIYKDKLPENEYLESIYKSKGNAKGVVKLSLPIKKKLKFDEIDLLVEADLSDFYAPVFFKGQAASNGKLKVSYDKAEINVSGKANLNDRVLDISYQRNFNKDTEVTEIIKVTGDVSSEYLKGLSLADIPFIEKNFNVDVEVKEELGVRTIGGEVDITNSLVRIAQAGFNKPEGAKGFIEFLSIYTDKYIDVSSFKVSGDGFSADGSMKISDGAVDNIKINNVKYAQNDYDALYVNHPDEIKIDIIGKSADFSQMAFSELFKQGSEGKKKALDIKADVKKLYMKNEKIFNDFSANINCSLKLCESINAYAKLPGDKFLVLSLKPIGDKSSLMVESDDAGAVIGALGISKHINGGRLTVESTFGEVENKKTAQGLIRIRDFTAVKTPILGKLFTLASLKGIEDLLNQKGITFSKFEAPFKMSDGVIIVSDAKTSGASVGITSSGTVDIKNNQIDLKGAIVPAYEVNKALGQIPLVGPLLIGKKNEGLIATNYRIKGPSDDVKITVNPLTILTPGFLRNIFDILPEKK